jgi:hypothetical protein
MQKARRAPILVGHSLGLRSVDPWREVLGLHHLCGVVGGGKPLHGRDVLGCLHAAGKTTWSRSRLHNFRTPARRRDVAVSLKIAIVTVRTWLGSLQYLLCSPCARAPVFGQSVSPGARCSAHTCPLAWKIFGTSILVNL